MDDWLRYLIPGISEQAQMATWIILIATMVNVSCALVGCYLVLRRMSLLGDALSHAVLPGLVLAFAFSGSLAIGWMFAGAFVVGLLTTFLTQALHREGNVPVDASMGIVFTSLFALGVVLLRRYAQGIHLDADCVLQGQLTMAPLSVVNLLGHTVPRAFLSILPALVANVAFVMLFWKELKITSFDAELATSMGFRAGVMHYLLMALVAVTAVGSFEAVGSILVVAMLIVPAATAYLLCDRLSTMMLVAVAVAVFAACAGFAWVAWLQDVEAAGLMTVVAGMCFLAAVLLSPRYGVLSMLVRNFQTSLRVVREDVLAMLFRLEELHAQRRLRSTEVVQAVGGGILARVALRTLFLSKAIVDTPEGLELTTLGRGRAERLVRSHRLWESYLVEYLGLPLDHVHAPAERMEHFIDERMEKELAADLAQPAIDPHGRQIPEVK